MRDDARDVVETAIEAEDPIDPMSLHDGQVQRAASG
jgi:hypothetical protein